jgi:hypothetical protein
MTRTWLLTLAALLALANTAPAQKVTWRPAGATSSDQATETARPSKPVKPCDATIWDCVATQASEPCCPTEGCRRCEDLRFTHGKAAAAKMLMPELLAEFTQTFNDGNLERAALIADFACKLQPECRAAQRARWLVTIVKQTRATAGAEECEQPRAKCDCGDKCCCTSAATCECGDKCDAKCACRADEQSRSEVVPGTNVHHVTAREILPAPTPVESVSSGQSTITAPGMAATADHVFTVVRGGEACILLEGNVVMFLNQKNHPARIQAARIVINPRDGSYEVMGANSISPSARPVKPVPNIKPTSEVMPITPMEQGWR